MMEHRCRQLGQPLKIHILGRGRQISELEASLVYRLSSRTARAIQRNPFSKKKKILNSNYLLFHKVK